MPVGLTHTRELLLTEETSQLVLSRHHRSALESQNLEARLANNLRHSHARNHMGQDCDAHLMEIVEAFCRIQNARMEGSN